MPSDALQQIERLTHLRTLAPQMLTGHLQGRLLSMLSHMIRPSCILEVGTFTGYSAICLAEGLAPGGRVHTIEAKTEYLSLIDEAIGLAGYQDRITCYIGQAVDIIAALPHTFDLVYLDANKREYQTYYELVLPNIRPGGFLLADNMLWGGKVLQPSDDADTEALQDFAQYLLEDPRVDNLLLPIRDGLAICRKI